MRTHTKFFNFSTLAVAGGASAVVRVAMVCNDLAIANSSLGHYKNLSPNALSRIRQGGMLNFVRMSCGHLREGMKAIRAIKNDAALSALVTRSCRFDFADVVIDTIVCRKLRAIPVGADV